MINLTSIPALFCLSAALGSAATVYTMDGSATFEHDSNGVNSPAPIPAAGSATIGTTGTFAWGDLATDTTSNFATFSGTTFTASDWGGDGTFTSVTIDVSVATEATITATGTSVFGASGEFFNFFYELDGGGAVPFASGENPVLDVTGISNLVVGFDFNHNGASDNVNVTTLSVDAVPEPSSLLLTGLGLLGLIRRRR